MLVLVLLDHKHLDNGPFLKSLALTITRIKDVRFLFIHSDSDYTDRVMQSGLMREDARMRSTRELNRRLVALFNDEGIHCVGLNGYQMNCVTRTGNHLNVDVEYLGKLLKHSHVILSNLVSDGKDKGKSFAEPAFFAKSLIKSLKPAHFIVFSRTETGGPLLPDLREGNTAEHTTRPEPLKSEIPVEIVDSDEELMVTNLRQFADLPDISGMEKVRLKVR